MVSHDAASQDCSPLFKLCAVPFVRSRFSASAPKFAGMAAAADMEVAMTGGTTAAMTGGTIADTTAVTTGGMTGATTAETITTVEVNSGPCQLGGSFCDHIILLSTPALSPRHFAIRTLEEACRVPTKRNDQSNRCKSRFHYSAT